jgi:hypothetical protein
MTSMGSILADERKRAAREALADVLRAIRTLPEALHAYELTGDHNHSWSSKSKPLAPGAPCPGGDCMVDEARKIIAALLPVLGVRS